MGGYFTGTGMGITVPAKILPCERFQTRKDIRGDNLRRNLRGRSTRAVQIITSILLYILVTVPVKYSPMELRELHTGGRGRGQVPPVPVNARPWNWGVSSVNQKARERIKFCHESKWLVRVDPTAVGTMSLTPQFHARVFSWWYSQVRKISPQIWMWMIPTLKDFCGEYTREYNRKNPSMWEIIRIHANSRGYFSYSQVSPWKYPPAWNWGVSEHWYMCHTHLLLYWSPQQGFSSSIQHGS